MINTLPGFLVVAGIALFVFSLFTRGISVKETSIPSLPEKSKPIVWLLSVTMVAVGSYLYYIEHTPLLTPPPKTVLWKINPAECKLINEAGVSGSKSGQIGNLELRIKRQKKSEKTSSVVCLLPTLVTDSSNVILLSDGGVIEWGTHTGSGGALRVGIALATSPQDAKQISRKWVSNWKKASSESQDLIESGTLGQLKITSSQAYVVFSLTSSWEGKEILLKIRNVRIESS